jgi:predicted DNA-binding transcriptional regulator YafY
LNIISLTSIPSRLAEIVLALREKERLSVAEMRQITGASGNTLVRDIKILKLLGWLKFHGSRKNGYFTLMAAVPVSKS